MQGHVRDWMTDLVVFVEPDTPVTEAIALMRRRYTNSVIVDRTPGSPEYGIVTSIDLQVRQREFLVRVFFFNALPMVMYSCLSDQFCTDFDIAPDECLDTFTRAFAGTFANHIAASRTGTELE